MAFGWTILVFYIFAGCKRFPPKVFMFVGLLGVCNALFQGLVFLLGKSDICESLGCSLGTGGRCAISASVFWFLTGITSCGAGQEAEEADEAAAAAAAADDQA